MTKVSKEPKDAVERPRFPGTIEDIVASLTPVAKGWSFAVYDWQQEELTHAVLSRHRPTWGNRRPAPRSELHHGQLATDRVQPWGQFGIHIDRGQQGHPC